MMRFYLLLFVLAGLSVAVILIFGRASKSDKMQRRREDEVLERLLGQKPKRPSSRPLWQMIVVVFGGILGLGFLCATVSSLGYGERAFGIIERFNDTLESSWWWSLLFVVVLLAVPLFFRRLRAIVRPEEGREFAAWPHLNITAVS